MLGGLEQRVLFQHGEPHINDRDDRSGKQHPHNDLVAFDVNDHERNAHDDYAHDDPLAPAGRHALASFCHPDVAEALKQADHDDEAEGVPHCGEDPHVH